MPETEYVFRPWRGRSGFFLGLIAVGVCGMVAEAALAIDEPNVHSFVAVESATGIGTLGLAVIWLLVFWRVFMRGSVDDDGVRGITVFRRPVDIPWERVKRARLTRSQSGATAGLLIHVQGGGRLMILAYGRNFAPAAEVAVAALRERGMIIESPGR